VHGSFHLLRHLRENPSLPLVRLKVSIEGVDATGMSRSFLSSGPLFIRLPRLAALAAVPILTVGTIGTVATVAAPALAPTIPSPPGHDDPGHGTGGQGGAVQDAPARPQEKPTAPRKPTRPAAAQTPPDGGAKKDGPRTAPPGADATKPPSNAPSKSDPERGPSASDDASDAGRTANAADAGHPLDPKQPLAARAAPAAGSSHAVEPALDAEQALRKLVEGNARFVHDLDNTTPRDITRRADLAAGQHPYAVVLACADSRVAPELVFDTDLGELFVLRVAGNGSDDAILGSMEYAIEHLGARLVVVLGHTRCGAVKATLDTVTAGKPASSLPGHLPAVVADIVPAVEESKSQPGDPLLNAIVRHVQRTVVAIRSAEPTLKTFVETKGVRVVGAIYDVATGEVDFVPEGSPSRPTKQVDVAGAREPEVEEHATEAGGHDHSER
jgi:carbonic anhydrase